MALFLVGVTAYTPLEKIADALLVIEEGRFFICGTARRAAFVSWSARARPKGRAGVSRFRGSSGQRTGRGCALDVRRRRCAANRPGVGGARDDRFLPTLTTAPRDELIRAARAVSEAWALQEKEGGAEARILGVHLEGPYLEPRMRGAHPGEHIRTPSKEEVEVIARAAGGLGVGGAPGLAMVTLSPEVAGAAEFTRWLAGKGVVPAMGHTRGKAACVEGVSGGGRCVRGSCV